MIGVRSRQIWWSAQRNVGSSMTSPAVIKVRKLPPRPSGRSAKAAAMTRSMVGAVPKCVTSAVFATRRSSRQSGEVGPPL